MFRNKIVQDIYRKYLKRDADPEGLKTYGELLKTRSQEHIINVIKQSEEYKTLQKIKKIHFTITKTEPGKFIQKVSQNIHIILYRSPREIVNHLKLNGIVQKTIFVSTLDATTIEKLYFGNESMYINTNFSLSSVNTEYIDKLTDNMSVFEIYKCLQYEVKEYQMIVARYNENTSWCNIFKNVLIYNKGDDMTSMFEVVDIPNEGREGETYLHHIIDNYDDLYEYNIFTQADPFEHNKDFITTVLECSQRFNSIQPLSYCWKEVDESCEWMNESNKTGIPPKEVRDLTKHYHFDSKHKIHVEWLDRDFKCVYPASWTDGGFNIHLIPRLKERNNIKTSVLEWVYLKLELYEDVPEYIPFCFSALFAVSKERILRRPIEFYKKLRLFLLEHPDHGYILERMWLLIFGY